MRSGDLELLHVSHIFYCFQSVSFLNYFIIDYHVFRNLSREKGKVIILREKLF